jgi:peptidoglycan/LPS O-acetylase OafA/YrhL
VDHIVTRAWRGAACQSGTVLRSPRPLAEDALLSMLVPLWQLVIAVVLLIVMAVAVWRLARRGRSRMTTAVVIAAIAVIGVNALALLLGGR